jgi:hypothetical protein
MVNKQGDEDKNFIALNSVVKFVYVGSYLGAERQKESKWMQQRFAQRRK